MMQGIGGYDYPQSAQECLPCARPNLKRRLLQEKENLETRLHKIQTVLDLLEESPEVDKIINAISELGAI